MKRLVVLFSVVVLLHVSQAQAGDFGKLKKLIESRDLEGLKKAISSGADVNDQGGLWKVTPLGLAVASQNIEIVKALVEAGADVNQANRLGYTALHQAALDNNLEIATYLINLGANVNSCASGTSPLISAIGSPDVALLLIESGADYDATSTCDLSFIDVVDAYSKDGNIAEKLRTGAARTKRLTFPIIDRLEREKRAVRQTGEDPFVSLLVDLVDYFNSPEGKVLRALSSEAIKYIQEQAEKYEPPAEPRISDFSDWYEHADGSRHREVTLFCPKPSGIVVEIEERYSSTGKHWFQRDAGAVLLPEHHDSLPTAIAIECSTGSGLIDRDRNEQSRQHDD